MIKRDIDKQVKKAARQFGVVSITGPRQSGKTTLSRSIFPNHQYVNLEDPATLSSLIDDPKAFIESIHNGVIIDEVQKFPDLLSYIQVSIDNNYKPGKFIITGSQNLLLSNKISQSLAGRVAVLTLLPLSINELNLPKTNPYQLILSGFYPGLYSKKLNRSLFYSSYLNTYIERDVRSISNIGSLTNFQRFLQVLSGRTGQLLNLTSISNDLGVTHKTIDSWISILEASYIVFRLQPYYKNYGKRVIKTPKIYFHDVGLAAYLLGINTEKELKSHFATGFLFENLIISDLLKTKHNHLLSSNLFFWRDKKGHEIDLLIDKGVKQILLEIKSSSTYNSNFTKNLDYYKTIAKKNYPSFIVYNGKTEQKIKNNQLLNPSKLSKVNKLLSSPTN